MYCNNFGDNCNNADTSRFILYDYMYIQYRWKYWRSLSLAVLPLNCVLSIIGICRYGMVLPYVQAHEIKFGEFFLAVERHTAKPPNFNSLANFLAIQ